MLEEKTIDDYMDSYRNDMESLAQEINKLKKEVIAAKFDGSVDWGEVIANLTLSYRHLEDAKMRLGKVKQAMNLGVNIFDKVTK